MDKTSYQNSKNEVTLVVRQRLKSGYESKYESWLTQVREIINKYNGFTGMHIIRPKSGDNEYIFVFGFDTQSNLDNWLNSKEKENWLSQVDDITTEVKAERLSGLEYWFNYIPGTTKPPAKYKMIALTVLGLYPIQLFILPLLAMQLKFLPTYLASLILTVLTITALTYIVIPWLSKLSKSWLYK